MSKVARLTWEDIAREYPKFRQVVEKHTKLKDGELTIEDEHGVFYTTKFNGAYLVWNIENRSIILNAIEGRDKKGAGVFMVLGTWIHIKSKLKDKVPQDGWLYLNRVNGDGQKFLARFFGFTDFQEVIEFVVNHGGSRNYRYINSLS